MTENLATLIRHHRKQSGLSQQDLAELAGVGKNLVYDLENGKDTVRWANLRKVLTVLNIQVEFRSPLLKSSRQESTDAQG